MISDRDIAVFYRKGFYIVIEGVTALEPTALLAERVQNISI